MASTRRAVQADVDEQQGGSGSQIAWSKCEREASIVRCTWRVLAGVRKTRDSSGVMTCGANSPAVDKAARHPRCLRWLWL